MRQIIVLEREDLDRLKSGHTLTLTVPGGKAIDMMLDSMRKNAKLKTIEANVSESDNRSHNEILKEFLRSRTGPVSAKEVKSSISALSSSQVGAAFISLNKQGLIVKHNVKNGGKTKFTYSLKEVE